MSTSHIPELSQRRNSVIHGQNRVKLWIYFLYCALTFFSAPYVFAQRGPHYKTTGLLFAVFLTVFVGGLLFSPRPRWIRRCLSSPLFWMLCLVLLAGFDELRYVQRILPHPETCSASPALMEPATRLLHFKDPYDVRLPDGAPISPGPDWIMLLAPITLPRAAGILTALSAFVLAALLSRKNPEAAGIFGLLVVLQPVLIISSAWGTDLFSIPIVYGILCLLADRWSGNHRLMMLLGVLTGIFAQSRLPMVVLAFILCIGVWRCNREDAKHLTVPAILVLVLSYTFFFLWTQHDHVFFQPLHLLSRERRSGVLPSVVGPIFGMAILLWVFFKMKGKSEQWLLAGGLLLVGTFAPTGFGELTGTIHQLKLWEGANYVAFGVSALAAYLAWGGVDEFSEADAGARA